MMDSLSLHSDSDGTYYTHHDMDRGDLCVTLTLALTEITDADPSETIMEIPKYVDPDALNSLFSSRPNGAPRHGGPLQLSTDDCEILIHSDGEIAIDVRDDVNGS